MAVTFLQGDVRVSSVERVMSRQLGQFLANVQRFCRATLLDAGKRIRRRMTRERLSGIKYPRNQAPKGAPLARKTGTLARSLKYETKANGNSFELTVAIGGGRAYYADRWEDEGRLQFGRVVKEEMTATREALKIGFAFLAANPARSGQLTPGAISGDDLVDARDAGDAGRFFAPTRATVLEGHFSAQRLRNRGGRPRKGALVNSSIGAAKKGFWDRDGLIPRSSFRHSSSAEAGFWRAVGWSSGRTF